MSRDLRQNTATRVTVGPFLDKTDGITPETGLTATNEKITFVVDDSGVPTLVIDATATASGGDNDLVHITNDDAGFYDLELTAAQVNYVGRAILSINYVTDHLPVFHEFNILTQAEWDAKYGTGNRNADMKAISGDSTAADNAESFFDGTGYAGTNNVIPTVTTLTNAVTVSDKTGFSLSATGADLILKGSTFVQAIVAAINEFATYGLTALHTLLVTTGIKTASTAAPADMATATNQATIAGYLDTEVSAIKTQTDKIGDATIGLANLKALIDAIDDYVDTEVAAIKAKTDNLPASPSSLTAQQVWEYATRTLSAFGFTVAATVADKTGYSLTAAYDAAKTAATQASVDTIDGIVDAIKLKTDTIPASPSTLTAQQVWEYATRTLSAFGFSVTVGTNNDKTGYSLTATPPTSAEIADKILGRTIAGSADGGRTVKDALRVLRNKVVIDTATGIITVYAEDDTTPAWTGVVTTTVGADPITAVDPV